MSYLNEIKAYMRDINLVVKSVTMNIIQLE
jgi:hypothetical protein